MGREPVGLQSTSIAHACEAVWYSRTEKVRVKT
jgi:hypothetical protein